MNVKGYWERVYKENSHLEVSWYQQRPTTSLALISSLNLDNTNHLIDVGGGASELIDCLLEEGFDNCSVLDVSPTALALAKQRLGVKSATVKWLAEDITKFNPKSDYTLWHDRAVFHFLTDDQDREKYKKVLQASVKTNGYVIIAAFTPTGPAKCSGLDIVQYDAQKLGKELGSSFSLVAEKAETHITPGGAEQSFGYYVFRKM